MMMVKWWLDDLMNQIKVILWSLRCDDDINAASRNLVTEAQSFQFQLCKSPSRIGQPQCSCSCQFVRSNGIVQRETHEPRGFFSGTLRQTQSVGWRTSARQSCVPTGPLGESAKLKHPGGWKRLGAARQAPKFSYRGQGVEPQKELQAVYFQQSLYILWNFLALCHCEPLYALEIQVLAVLSTCLLLDSHKGEEHESAEVRNPLRLLGTCRNI